MLVPGVYDPGSITIDNGQSMSDSSGPAGADLHPVTDPADWRADDLAAADDWIFHLTDREIGEIDSAIAAVEAAGLEISDIAEDDFPLPSLHTRLKDIEHSILHGRV